MLNLQLNKSLIHGLPYFLQPMVGEGLQFLQGRQTVLITLTGRRPLLASRRKRICCVESEMDTNIMTLHPSQDTLVSLKAIMLDD